MTGLALGLVLAVGVTLIWSACWGGRREGTGASPRAWRAFTDDLAACGLGRHAARQVLAAAGVLAMLAGLLAWAVTINLGAAMFFSAGGAWSPILWVRSRAARRRRSLREVWPDVVDHVASAVRAGMALPEALGQLGERGPEQLRRHFRAFAADYAATGNFASSLDLLKERLADPVGDRLVESLRIAREVGGSDLGRLLRALSSFLREDARTRAELEARQGWTVSAARLALAAPWAVLALLVSRGQALEAYRTRTGVAVLVVGALVSAVAYQIMRRVGRIPDERRVMV